MKGLVKTTTEIPQHPILDLFNYVPVRKYN